MKKWALTNKLAVGLFVGVLFLSYAAEYYPPPC